MLSITPLNVYKVFGGRIPHILEMSDQIQSLYPHGNSPWQPLFWSMDDPHIWSECSGEDEKYSPSREMNPSCPVSCKSLCWLSCPGPYIKQFKKSFSLLFSSYWYVHCVFKTPLCKLYDVCFRYCQHSWLTCLSIMTLLPLILASWHFMWPTRTC